MSRLTSLREGRDPAGDAAVAHRPTPSEHSWRTAWMEAALLVTITRLVVFAISWSATWLLSTRGRGPHVPGFLTIWDRWDTVHFVHIALHGYGARHGFFSHDTAFFPAYPLAIRGLHYLGLEPVAAGLVVSFVAGIVACAYLHRLATDQLGPGAGPRAVLFLLLAPTAVFLAAAYSESLYLAGAIAAFYYARRQLWPAAGVAAALAMATRAAALFLLLGLAVEFVVQRRFSLRRVGAAMAAAAIALLPLAAYCAYLAVQGGDALEFLAAQRAGWYRTFVGPVGSFLATWRTWNEAQPTNWIFAWRLEIVAAALGVGFTLWALLKRWWGYGVYMAATMAYLLTSTWYFSIPRLLLGLFPIPLLLAGWAQTRARRDLMLAVLGPLSALGVIVFTQGAWFF